MKQILFKFQTKRKEFVAFIVRFHIILLRMIFIKFRRKKTVPEEKFQL